MALQMDVQELPALEGMPEELADRIRRMVEENANGIEIPMGPFAEPNDIAPSELGGAMEEMRKRIKGIQGGMKFELGSTRMGSMRNISPHFE